MRTIAILISMGVLMAAETPKPKPEAVKPDMPKTATLDPEKLQTLEREMESAAKSKRIADLEAAAAARAQKDIQDAYVALIAQACATIGGATAQDCEPLERKPGQTQVIRLKVVAAKAVKP